MNNIIFHNAIRSTDKEIAQMSAETQEIVEHGYLCDPKCYLRIRKLCGSRNGQCSWDLRSGFYKKR